MERGREVLASFSTDSPVSSRQENEGVKGEPGNKAKEVSHVTINNLWENNNNNNNNKKFVVQMQAPKLMTSDKGILLFMINCKSGLEACFSCRES